MNLNIILPLPGNTATAHEPSNDLGKPLVKLLAGDVAALVLIDRLHQRLRSREG